MVRKILLKISHYVVKLDGYMWTLLHAKKIREQREDN